MPAATPEQIAPFITRWENSGAAGRANYQMFLSGLCDILDVLRPDPTSPDPAKNLRAFNRVITRINPDGSSVDASTDEPAKPVFTKSGHAKRGTAIFDRTFRQGRGYINLRPVSEERPPFLAPAESGDNSSP